MKTPIAEAVEAEMLAEQLHQLAQRLRGERANDAPSAEPLEAGVSGGSSYVELARQMYQARRLRAKMLPAELFGEPAWDMLLDLYISCVEGREINITSAGLASCVPPTTSLRYIALMEELGLVERYNAAHDRRVHYVRLTLHGARRIQRYLHRHVTERSRNRSAFFLASAN